ncbi:DUF805 domain-containing protein [Pseudomonas sp. NPDC089554]|uniref:DUF805 domain-containing protein n=1 Tax=Pseudomonas sp. NPDC089554 TaxID=3390653 RepID=UPI003D04B3D7
MVFCRACAKEIHQTASSCPGCGATQLATDVGTTNAALSHTPITFGNVFFEVMKKYATFQGRARRKEYWLFLLVSTLISFFIGFVEGLVGAPQFLSSLFSLVVLLPGIAVAVRRLHDSNHSGWWLLVPIVNLIFMIQEGTSGANRFGADPKATI